MTFFKNEKTRLSILIAAVAFNFVACSSDETTKEEYLTYENHIDLQGEDNMRDLGGFVGQGNKRVLFHKLFRSGELSALTTNDLDELTSLGIKNIFDLRTDEEQLEHPDVLPTGVSPYHFPLLSDVNIGGSIDINQVLSGQVSGEEFMIPLYLVDEIKIENWKMIFDILEESNQTTLWHCTAGKDRAGMTTALVLSALGVDKETIINDFLASNEYLKDYIETTVAYMNASYGAGIGENMRPVLGVERIYIETFFNDIDQNHGGMNAFLAEIGVDIKKMKANYLEK